MEEGKTGERAGHTPSNVAAAEHLLRSGWWNLEENEKKALEPLLKGGLTVGVNLNFAKLGLKPALVLADTKGRASLWDVAGDSSFALRSYYSSSLRSLMLSVPPLDIKTYRSFWNSKQREGVAERVSVHPLQDIRFLTAPIESFNEDRRSFDFTWDNLPHRRYEEADKREKPMPAGPDTILVLNELLKNPTVKSLGEVSAVTGVELGKCVEATRFIRDFPIGWGFQGPIDSGASGLILLYTGLRDDIFGAVRAGIRDVPFGVLEAWGRDSDGFVYFASLSIPGPSLAETTEYIGKISSICDDSFSYGFYETMELERYPLSRKLPGEYRAEPQSL